MSQFLFTKQMNQKQHVSFVSFKTSKTSSGNLWHYLVLPKSDLPNIVFLLFSCESQKKAVALCGTMSPYISLPPKKNIGKTFVFAVFLGFSKNNCGTMWHSVALSCFVKKGQNHQKNHCFCHFLHNPQNQLWHYVLCGTMWQSCFAQKWQNCQKHRFFVFLEISKNSCGTLWHYVALSCFAQKLQNSKNSVFLLFSRKSQKTAVALCGTMWHYLVLPKSGKIAKNSVKIAKNRVFCCFLGNLKKQLWNYVALSCFAQKLQNCQKQCFLPFSWKSQKPAVALCGTMWHYVALSCFAQKWQNCQKQCFLLFSWKSQKTAVALCGTMWHYLVLPKSGKIAKNRVFCCFLGNLKNKLWHYVALCGTILFYQKNAKLAKNNDFCCFLGNL